MIMRFVWVAFVLSFAFNLAILLSRLDWWVPLALLLGWAVADLVSGIVHMLMDYVSVPAELEFDKIYFTDKQTKRTLKPLQKQLMQRAGVFYRIAYDFKVHHLHPEFLAQRDFHTLTWATVSFGALPLSLALNGLILAFAVPGWLIAGWMTLILGAVLVQYLHACMHHPRPPRAIVTAQRLGLVMTPAAHQIHHNTLDRCFGIINGWTNPLLNPVFNLLHRAGIFKAHDLEPPRPSVAQAAPAAE